MIKYMSKSVTEFVTESHGKSWRVMEIVTWKYKHSTKMELPMVWGNVKCTDRVGGVGWCNGRCDGQSV